MSEPKRKRTYRNWLDIDLYNSLLESKPSDPWRSDMLAALKARQADDVLHSLKINGQDID